MKLKKCSKCGVKKPATREHFNKCRNSLQSWCKECKKKNHEANKEEILRKRREKWRAEHPKEDIPEGMKKCSRCKEIKPKTTEFFNKSKKDKDGFKFHCKECRKKEYDKYSERAKENNKKRYEEKKDEILKKTKEYKEKRKEWYREYHKSYYTENQEEIKENVKLNHYQRMKNDLGYKLLQRCRNRVYKALKGLSKSKSTIELIGCTPEKLIQHIENQFEEGMTWENYGKWHLDHIKPCAVFDFKDEKQQQECFHYLNLQPLWAEDNHRKSASYEASN